MYMHYQGLKAISAYACMSELNITALLSCIHGFICGSTALIFTMKKESDYGAWVEMQ